MRSSRPETTDYLSVPGEAIFDGHAGAIFQSRSEHPNEITIQLN